MFGLGKKNVKLMKALAKRLDRDGIKYRMNEEKVYLVVNYRADNFDDQDFQFAFGEDGKTFTLYAFSIEKFEDYQLKDAYEFCQKMNAEYKWMKFYIDDDKELTAQYDGVVNTDTIGEVGVEILGHAVAIVDEAVGALKN